MKTKLTLYEYITICFADIGKAIFDNNEYSLINRLGCINEKGNSNIRNYYIHLSAFLVFIIFLVEGEIRQINIEVLNEAKKVGKDFLKFSFSRQGIDEIHEKEWYECLCIYKRLLDNLPSATSLENRCKNIANLTIKNIDISYIDDPIDNILFFNVSALACDEIKRISKEISY